MTLFPKDPRERQIETGKQRCREDGPLCAGQFPRRVDETLSLSAVDANDVSLGIDHPVL